MTSSPIAKADIPLPCTVPHEAERVVLERTRLPAGSATLERWCLICGAVAALLSALGAIWWPTDFARAMLPTFLFVWGLSIGSLSFLFLTQLVGGAWSQVALPVLIAAARVLPFTVLLAIPLALALPELYPWTDPSIWAGHSDAGNRPRYFEPTFF